MAVSCPTSVRVFLTDLGFSTERLENALPRLETFRELLEDRNRKHNLTRLTSPTDFWIKHVADSAAAVNPLPELLDAPWTVADVGCGAGIPLIPLALLCPQLQLTGIDSKQKRRSFVDEAIECLKLVNVSTHCSQAREAANTRNLARGFDLVTARAVASAERLINDTQQLLKPGTGILLLYKTPKTVRKESQTATAAAKKQGMQVHTPSPFNLPENAGARQFLIVRTVCNSRHSRVK